MHTETNSVPIEAPDGTTIAIPARYDPASDPYDALTDPAALRAYFDREGYVVVRNLVPAERCDALVLGFEREVKPDRGYFKRQSSSLAERHDFTPHGHMRNPLLHIHDLPRSKYPRFVEEAIAITTHARVREVMQVLLGDPGKLIQTMFFEGNPRTWAHHDSYYIDSEVIGAMLGCWIALEEIDPGAGRFFVYPGSHRLPMPLFGRDTDLDPREPGYKQQVLETIREHRLQLRAPALRKGDALFWPSTMIHGSLPTLTPERSRRCITTHYIPVAHDVITLHQHRHRLKFREVNGVQMHFHKDMNLLRNRLLFELEARFPAPYRLVKGLVPRSR